VPIVRDEALDLREMLDAVLASKSDHAPRLAKSAAIVCEALRREGLEATVVGGAAIELHAPDAYATHDLDLVVSGRFSIDWSAVQARTFQSLGFTRSARHWVRLRRLADSDEPADTERVARELEALRSRGE